MRRPISQRNFIAKSSSGCSSAAPANGSAGSTNRKSPPPPPRNRKVVRETGIAKVVAEHAIVIVALRGCFMCVSVTALVHALGGNPKIVEVVEEEKSAMLVKLLKIEGGGGPWELPAVYVGGKLLGGVDKVMEAHVKGEFVPMLKAAGALWL